MAEAVAAPALGRLVVVGLGLIGGSFAKGLRDKGLFREVIGVDKVIEIDPALADKLDEIAGATYTAEDESGDALKYTQELARVCERMGGVFHYDHQVTALHADRATREVRAAIVRQRESFGLSIRVSPSFGVRWLSPKLIEFSRVQFNWELRVDATPTVSDFATEVVDLDRSFV